MKTSDPSTKRPPDEIQSGRLILRKHKLEHAPALFKCIDQDRERLRTFLPWVDVTCTVLDAAVYINLTHEKWDRGEIFDYAIFSRNEENFLGVVDVHEINWSESRCEIGYWILGQYEGKGYVSEALGVLEKTLCKIGLNQLEIRCSAKNEKSIRFAERNGYALEETRENHTSEQSAFRDTLVFSKKQP